MRVSDVRLNLFSTPRQPPQIQTPLSVNAFLQVHQNTKRKSEKDNREKDMDGAYGVSPNLPPRDDGLPTHSPGRKRRHRVSSHSAGGALFPRKSLRIKLTAATSNRLASSGSGLLAVPSAESKEEPLEISYTAGQTIAMFPNLCSSQLASLRTRAQRDSRRVRMRRLHPASVLQNIRFASRGRILAWATRIFD